MVTVIFYLAAIGTLISISLILPVLIAFGYGETEVAFRLIIYTGLGGFLSTSTLLATSGRSGSLDRISSIYLATLVWVGIPLILAIPFADILGLTYMDGVFETVSAFTTTAADQFQSLETMPKSILFARAQLQWIGGMATLLTVILIITPGKLGGMPQFGGSAATQVVFSNANSLVDFCWKIARIYLALTLACLGALLMAGIPPFDASILSMTAISTGGYLPGTRDLSSTAGNDGMVILSVFFMISCTSVFWHRMLVRLRMSELRAHRESYFVFGVFLALAFYFTHQIIIASGAAPGFLLDRISEGIFNAASVVSTSGLQSRPGIFALLAPTLVLLILLMGAGSFSTASGVKFYRIGGMLRQAGHEINLLIYPHSIRSRKLGSITYDIQMMKAIWTVFLLMLGTIAIGALALTVHGMNFQAGYTAAIAAFTNAGPAYGPEWAPQTELGWPHYGQMIAQQKFTLCLLMLLGRLEVILLLVSVNFGYWSNR